MELNWLPDHKALETIAGPLGPMYSDNAAGSVIAGTPGAVPAAIDPGLREVIWADVGRRDLNEWQFLFSLKTLKEENGALTTFRTPLSQLGLAAAAADDLLEPAGFIFHMSRCGSTLLGNVLNGSQRHLVINQPGPFQDGFWTAFTDDWSDTAALEDEVSSREALAMFQYLVSLVLRRRSTSGELGFIKFRSWVVRFLPFIQSVFPHVPCLFLYRDPLEVLGSIAQKRNVATFATIPQKKFLARCDDRKLNGLGDTDFMLRCFCGYFESALSAASRNLFYLNYHSLDENILPKLMKFVFSIDPTDSELSEMSTRFGYYSKGPAQAMTIFDRKADKEAKIALVKDSDIGRLNPLLDTLYEQLEKSPRNIAGCL